MPGGHQGQIVALLFCISLCQLRIDPVSAVSCTNDPELHVAGSWTTSSTTCTTKSYLYGDGDSDSITPSITVFAPDPGTAPFTVAESGGNVDLTCDQTKVQAAAIRTYTLTILLDDGCASRDPKTTVDVTVEFTDITASANNNDPQITPTSTDVARYLYDRDGETDVLAFTLTDDDTGADGEIASVIITEKPASAPFRIDYTAPTATLKITGSLTTMPSTLTLTIEATDNGSSPRKGTITFTVNIKDPPSISSPTDGGTLYFCEDFEAGDAVANLTSTNPNSGTLAYTVTSQSPGTFFTADDATSELQIKAGVASGTFDVDAAAAVTQYTLTLKVSDGTYDSSINLTLEVDDVNDETPQITSFENTKNILDSLAAGSTIMTVAATDADRDSPNNQVTFSLSGTNNENFIFDGSIMKLATPSLLNYDNVPVYNLKIVATDQADDPDKLSSTEDITITIDTAPELDPTYAANITEDSQSPAQVKELAATDKDKVAKGTGLTYSITGGNDAGYFVVDGASIKVAAGIPNSALDIDGQAGDKTFTLDVMVSDGTYTDTTILTIYIDDVNDNSPVFEHASYSFDVYEKSAAGTVVATVVATDDDRTSPNNQVTYTLSGTNADDFEITEVGELRIAAGKVLNYTEVATYSLTITASDGGVPAMTASVTATGSVVTAPEFSSDTYDIDMGEDKPADTSVFTMTAIDRDGQTLTYTLDDASGHFKVEGSLVKTSDNIDDTTFDVDVATKTFQINLMVSDGTYNDTAILTISIDDANDNSPVFEHASYSFDVYEQSAAGTVIATVVATDDDRTSPNNQVTYTLSGTNADDFEITDVGELKIAAGKVLNYTEVATYSLTITASDGGVPAMTASVTATGSVVTAPEFSSDTYAIDMGEDKPADTSVFTMTAIDRDGQTLTYTLDDASGHFKVEGSLVKTSDNIDDTTFDVDVATKTFQINLIVDDGTYNDTAVLTINVVDVNDNPPVFAEDSYRSGINEDTPEGTVVLTVAASDADRTATNNQVTHSITGTGVGHFLIDTTTGTIELATVLDFTAVPEYNLTVTAIDSGSPSLTASVPVTFSVETTPEFERPNTVEDPTSILEDKNPGELVYTFVTVDKDTPEEELTYSIVDASSTPVPFEILGDELRTKSDMVASNIDVDSDTAVRSYTITVRVNDGKYSDTGIVTINIADVNDEVPSFTEVSYTVDITENATGVITTVAAEDKDYETPNNEVSFSISDGNDEGVFAINNETGAISVVKEVKQVGYKIEVSATDGGSPANVAKAIVVVNVDGNTIDECASGPCANGATCRPNVNYFWCDCAAGWDGTLCKVNIDDCSPDPCENGGSCQDQVAGYTCDCEPGWGGINCTTACMGHTYGRNCVQPCSCNNSNIADTAQAQRCEIKAGACICNSNWQGRTCDENADECIQDSTLCPAVNNACEDTIGSYKCVCKTGYTTDANLDCIIDTSDNNPKNLPSNAADNAKANGRVPVMITVVLVVAQCPNLDVPSVYTSTWESLISQLTNVISKPFKVYNIRCGSLTYNIFVENDATSEAAADLSNELKTLKDNGTMTVLDQAVSISSMSVNQNDVPTENRLCVIYESLTTCGDDYICQVHDGKPYCREVKDNNTGLIMGVGIGVGVTGILLLGICIVIMALVRRHRQSARLKNGSRYSSNSRSHKRDYRQNSYDNGRQYDVYGPSRKYDDGPSHLSSSMHNSPMYEAYALPSRYSAKYY